jgi:hypothetical protein
LTQFSPSYALARSRLLGGAEVLRARLPLLIDSRELTVRGPHDETLALDWIMFGARRPRRALVLSSGTHGAEGFAGSAVQLAIVTQILPTLDVPDDLAIVMLHAINPFGFAWTRRVNENNVDLNRNFVDSEVYAARPCPATYEALYDALHPADLELQADAARRKQLADFWTAHGWRAFHEAVLGGQYRHPQGLQFGGHQREPSAQHLAALLGDHLAATEQLCWIDIHTGLGAYGACELITSAMPAEPRYRYANQVWPGQVKSANAGESVSTPLTGLLDDGVAALVPRSTRLAFAYAEFGTFATEPIFYTLRAENWYYGHGQIDSAAGRAAQAEMRQQFCPADPAWRAGVVATSLAYVDQALGALDRPFVH